MMMMIGLQVRVKMIIDHDEDDYHVEYHNHDLCLQNVQHLFIRATEAADTTIAMLHGISLDVARPSAPGAPRQALGVEQCTCPPQYGKYFWVCYDKFYGHCEPVCRRHLLPGPGPRLLPLVQGGVRGERDHHRPGGGQQEGELSLVISRSRDTSSHLSLASASATAAPTPVTPTPARARAAASTRPGRAATSAPRASTASPRPGRRAAAASVPPASGTSPRPAAATPPAASCAGAGEKAKNICMC